ncbi:MAG: PH domain-containing protein [Thermoanaerobaculia bacterium]
MSTDSKSPDPKKRFECTLAGSISSGRSRLTLLLVGLGVLMLGVAVAMLLSGRFFPATLSFVVGLIALFCWRLSHDLEPLWIEVEDTEFSIYLRSRRVRFPLPVRSARVLEANEKKHLVGLASAGGIVAGAGGFDSHLLGEFELYASNLDNAVLVEAGAVRLVLSPDDPGGFVAALGKPDPAYFGPEFASL